MLIRRLAMLLVIGLAFPVEAFDEPQSFRRIPWGASVDEAKTILEQSSQAMPQHLRSLAKPQCADASLCVTHVMFGPVFAKAYLQFREGRFVGGAFSFKPDRYPEMRAIFMEKYGVPSLQQREAVRTQGGQESVNEILMWKGSSVVISLARYRRNVREGGGSVVLRGEQHDTPVPKKQPF